MFPSLACFYFAGNGGERRTWRWKGRVQFRASQVNLATGGGGRKMMSWKSPLPSSSLPLLYTLARCTERAFQSNNSSSSLQFGGAAAVLLSLLQNSMPPMPTVPPSQFPSLCEVSQMTSNRSWAKKCMEFHWQENSELFWRCDWCRISSLFIISRAIPCWPRSCQMLFFARGRHKVAPPQASQSFGKLNSMRCQTSPLPKTSFIRVYVAQAHVLFQKGAL